MSTNKLGADPSSFTYVDARYGSSKWNRIAVQDLPAFVEKNRFHDVYCTVQRYALKTDGARTSGRDEVMIAPLFFDFDAKWHVLNLLDQGDIALADLHPLLPPPIYALLERREKGLPYPDLLEVELGIKPYAVENADDRELRKELYRELSEDLKMLVWRKNIDIAREDAMRVVDFFMAFGLSEDEARVWFSGNKGFHVCIQEQAAGVRPHNQLHKMIKHTALFLEELLELRSLDKVIYAKGRMWRLPDTVHAKTGRYKTEFSHSEMRGDVSSILERSKMPHGPLYREEDQYFEVRPQLSTWYERLRVEWEENERVLVNTSAPKNAVLEEMGSYPACVKYLIDHSADLIRQTGTTRNAITFRLATYFKDVGFTLHQTYERLLEWALALSHDVSHSSASEKRANTMSAVKAVYDNENSYHFSCAGIRSIGKRSIRDKTIVPCSGRICPVHDDHGLDDVPSTKMHLADTAKAQYVNEKVSFDCLVAGKLDTPYQVAKKVQYTCKSMSTERAICQSCVMMEANGSFEKEFHENERVLIEATNQPDNNVLGILRRHSGASCNKVTANVLEYTNITEVLVVPMAERVQSIRVNDDESVTPLEKPVDETGAEYAYRKVYAIGTDIRSNNHYEFTGYVYPHPKNQLATVLSQEQRPKSDNIGSFQLTDEIREAFKIFQVQPGERLGDRLDVIVSDLVGNVTKVRQRDQVHLAVLMTYHSVLRYYFTPDELEARGWMELCLVGDSGQAKTLLVNRLQEYIGIGSMIGGETAGRTGILYSLQQVGERWFVTFGEYPLNDRKLLAIDEFSGLSEGDWEQMTEARETGVLRIHRIVKTETNARTRLVLMTNPRYGKQLGEYSYGVESLKQLFREAADIRRLDLAVFLKSGDVPQSVLNAKFKRPSVQLVKRDVLKASVLWAWSRTEDQITITEPAMDRILEQATRMGEKYGSAVDVPLLEPATLRKKLARMSIALAALVHSTDAEHEKIIVLPAHVDFVCEFLDTIYSYKNCRLDRYAELARQSSILTQDEADEIMREFSSGDFGDNMFATREILEVFRKNDVLKMNELQDYTGLDKSTINSRVTLLGKYSMLRKTKDGMRKQPKFIEFLEMYFGED